MHDSQEERQDPGYSNGTGSFFMGLMCGVAVGAALGLMLAPKPGVELRQQIGTSAARLKRKASETYDDATQALGNVVSKTKRAFESGREAFQSSRPAEEPSAPSGSSI